MLAGHKLALDADNCTSSSIPNQPSTRLRRVSRSVIKWKRHVSLQYVNIAPSPFLPCHVFHCVLSRLCKLTFTNGAAKTQENSACWFSNAQVVPKATQAPTKSALPTIHFHGEANQSGLKRPAARAPRTKQRGTLENKKTSPGKAMPCPTVRKGGAGRRSTGMTPAEIRHEVATIPRTILNWFGPFKVFFCSTHLCSSLGP